MGNVTPYGRGSSVEVAMAVRLVGQCVSSTAISGPLQNISTALKEPPFLRTSATAGR